MLKNLMPGDTVIVTAPHRLFRNTREAAIQLDKWEKLNIRICFTQLKVDTSSAAGKLLLSMMFAAAQWESDIRSQRMKESAAWRKKKAPLNPEKKEALQKEHRSFEINSQPVDLFTRCWLRVHGKSVDPPKSTGVIRAYTRVSDGRQNILVSQDALQVLCDSDPSMQGRPVVWYTDHGRSAFRTAFHERPQAKKLMADLQPGDLVVSLRADRMVRSLIDSSRVITKIHEKGAYLYLADCGMRTDESMGAILFSLLAFVAQLESENIRRGIRIGKATKWAVTGVPDSQKRDVFRGPVTEPRRSSNRKGFSACLRHLIPDDLVARTYQRFVEIVESGESASVYKLDRSKIVPGYLKASAMAEAELSQLVGLPAGVRKLVWRVAERNGKGISVQEAIRRIQTDYPDGDLQKKAIEFLSGLDPQAPYAGLIGRYWLSNSKRLKNMHQDIQRFREALKYEGGIQGQLVGSATGTRADLKKLIALMQ